MPTLMPLPDFFVSSDAAASLGCGAIWGSYWFSFAWPESFAGHNITVLELFPLVVAAHVWGHLWLRLQIVMFPVVRTRPLMHCLVSIFRSSDASIHRPAPLPHQSHTSPTPVPSSVLQRLLCMS
jgi:hypothetical protein